MALYSDELISLLAPSNCKWNGTTPSGDLGQRIDARLHDLGQLQLEDGNRSHVSKANFSKNAR